MDSLNQAHPGITLRGFNYLFGAYEIFIRSRLNFGFLDLGALEFKLFLHPLELGEPLFFLFQSRLYLGECWWFGRMFTLPLGQPLLGLTAFQVFGFVGFTMIL